LNHKVKELEEDVLFLRKHLFLTLASNKASSSSAPHNDPLISQATNNPTVVASSISMPTSVKPNVVEKDVKNVKDSGHSIPILEVNAVKLSKVAGQLPKFEALIHENFEIAIKQLTDPGSSCDKSPTISKHPKGVKHALQKLNFSQTKRDEPVVSSPPTNPLLFTASDIPKLNLSTISSNSSLLGEPLLRRFRSNDEMASPSEIESDSDDDDDDSNEEETSKTPSSSKKKRSLSNISRTKSASLGSIDDLRTSKMRNILNKMFYGKQGLVELLLQIPD